jgi:hypothetical protein
MTRVAALAGWTLAALACSGPPGGSVDDAGAPAPDAAIEPDSYPRPVCSDERDNDGDGKVDYGPEPGCESPSDDDETDDCPDGPSCPQCGNEMDDDGDGAVDWPAEDVNCTSAADPDEFFSDGPCRGAPVQVLELVDGSGTATGTFSAKMGEVESWVESDVCGGWGGEVIHVLVLEAGAATLTVSTVDPATSADTVVYVRPICLSPHGELGCDDDGAGQLGGPSLLTLSDVEVGVYFVIVDTFGPGSLGDYVLHVTAVSP